MLAGATRQKQRAGEFHGEGLGLHPKGDGEPWQVASKGMTQSDGASERPLWWLGGARACQERLGSGRSGGPALSQGREAAPRTAARREGGLTRILRRGRYTALETAWKWWQEGEEMPMMHKFSPRIEKREFRCSIFPLWVKEEKFSRLTCGV